MPDTLIVASFYRLLQAFAPCFTAPSFRTFITVMCGWSLTLSRHTVAGVVRAANAVGKSAGASMHRDPLLSTGKKPVFHWGHVWVVVGLSMELFGKTWCLPVVTDPL